MWRDKECLTHSTYIYMRAFSSQSWDACVLGLLSFHSYCCICADNNVCMHAELELRYYQGVVVLQQLRPRTSVRAGGRTSGEVCPGSIIFVFCAWEALAHITLAVLKNILFTEPLTQYAPLEFGTEVLSLNRTHPNTVIELK